MKKLVSLILVLAMVLACSVAMAEDPTRFGSSNDVPEVPEFVEPISMKTKRSGDTVKVTLGGEVDSIEVLWYGAGESFEELEVVDGVAKYNAAGHRYQPGVWGSAMNITRGNASAQDILDFGAVAYNTLGQQINNQGTLGYTAIAFVDPFADVDAHTNQARPYDIDEDYWSIPEELPDKYDNDALVLLDANGNVVRSYAAARAAVADILDRTDFYRYIDMYDWRVSDTYSWPRWLDAKDASSYTNWIDFEWETQSNGWAYYLDGFTETGYTGANRVYAWTLERTTVTDPSTGITYPAFKVLQLWGLKHDGAAYRVVIGDVAFYYDRAGKFMYEEICVADSDPFGVGESGTTFYTYTTYSSVGVRTNARYWLSKVESVFEEGDIADVYQTFLGNAGKTGNYMHVIGR